MEAIAAGRRAHDRRGRRRRRRRRDPARDAVPCPRCVRRRRAALRAGDRPAAPAAATSGVGAPRLGRVLVEREVVLHLDSAAVAVEPGAVLTSGGRRIAADRIVWATSASAPPWLAAAGLDVRRRAASSRIDAYLRSTSHPFVFAAGDCATQLAHPRPKSGVYAVRQGPPLAHNLRQAVDGEPLAPYVPQRQALALISTGGRHAIASRGSWAVEGDWVWRWKDWIDRRFIARYAPAPLPAPRERRTGAGLEWRACGSASSRFAGVPRSRRRRSRGCAAAARARAGAGADRAGAAAGVRRTAGSSRATPAWPARRTAASCRTPASS